MKTWPLPTPPLRVLALSLLVLAATAAGCSGDDHDHEHGEEDVDAEICEHMGEGPAQPVVGATDPTAGELPDVSMSHTRYDIALTDDGSGGYVGHVGYAADEATDFVIAVDRAITLAVTAADGTALMAEESAANPDCAGVTHHVYELPVGTATLQFTSATEDQVRVVIEESGHEHTGE